MPLTPSTNRFAISHRGQARGRDYETWREGIWRGFCRLDVGPAVGDFIDCHNQFALVHSIAMATPKGGSARFARTRDLLKDGCDDLVLIAATHGSVRVTQGSKTVDLTEGQMVLTEMNVPGTADLTTIGGFTTTRIPRPFLLQVSPDAERQIARKLDQDPGPRAMVNRYFELCNEVATGLDAAGQKAAAQHMVDLVGMVLGNQGHQKDLPQQRGLSAARLELLKADILKNLEWHHLSLAALANANGLSERQAQRLFAESGSTFSEFTLEERLVLARRRLLHQTGRFRKVSDIAYASGFGDLSYFNKTFRKRFGMTPTMMQHEFHKTDQTLE